MQFSVIKAALPPRNRARRPSSSHRHFCVRFTKMVGAGNGMISSLGDHGERIVLHIHVDWWAITIARSHDRIRTELAVSPPSQDTDTGAYRAGDCPGEAIAAARPVCQCRVPVRCAPVV